MPRSYGLFPDLQGPLIEAFGLLVVPLSARKIRQALECVGDIWMLQPQSLFPDLQGPLIQRLGLLISPLLSSEIRQTLERVSYQRGLWAVKRTKRAAI